MTRLVGDSYVTLTMTDSLVKDRWRASRIKREMVAQAASKDSEVKAESPGEGKEKMT
jgi:hypothetical protein